MSIMSATVRAIFYTLAVLCFLAGAAGVKSRVNLTAAGLALFVFVFAWDAWAEA